MTKLSKKTNTNTPINENEIEELIRLIKENRLLKMKIIYEKSYKSCYWKRKQKQGKLKLQTEYPESKIREWLEYPYYQNHHTVNGKKI